MDPILAKMFNLDRPIQERIEERLLAGEFVKIAADKGVNLSEVPDGDVARAWHDFKEAHRLEKISAARQFDLMRAGRALARRMSKVAQTPSLGDADFTDAFRSNYILDLDPQHYSSHVDLINKIRHQGGDAFKNMISRGYFPDKDTAGAFAKKMGVSEDMGKALFDEVLKADPTVKDRIIRIEMARAQGIPKHIATAPLDLHKELLATRGWAPAPAAEAGESMLKRFLPVGIGDALKNKQWGRVATKSMPLGIAGLAGLSWLRNRGEGSVIQPFGGPPVPMR